MSYEYSEDGLVETATKDVLEELGWKVANLYQKDYAILTSTPRLDAIAKDLVWHFNERGYQGKAMLVTLDKPTAVKTYDLIMKHWSDYVADLKQRIKNAEDI